MGPGVRRGEAEKSSGSGAVGAVWRELGLHSGSGLLPVPPSQGQGSHSQRNLHSQEVHIVNKCIVKLFVKVYVYC